MEQTSNYQLNQWEMNDLIMMEDFNADNHKIAQALKGNADAIAAETAARQQAVAAEANSRKSAINTEKSARQSADNTEKAAREAADSAEATARQNADSNLQSAINAEVSNRMAAVNAEAAARQAAVAALSAKAGLQLLKTATLGANTADWFSLSTEGIDFSQWAVLFLVVNSETNYKLYANQSTSMFDNSGHPEGAAILFPMFQASAHLKGLILYDYNVIDQRSWTSHTYDTTTSFDLKARNGALLAGTTLTLYGIH